MSANKSQASSSALYERTRTGHWVTIDLQLPGSKAKPAGILLWDPAGDTLLFSIRELTQDEGDDDIVAFWSELPMWLRSVTGDIGGLEAVELLEASSSHVLQLSERTAIDIGQPSALLRSLFEAHVLSARDTPKFHDDDLSAARARLPLLPSSAVQIIAALNSSIMGINEIERLISRDPVLAAHMIRIANLAAFQVKEPARSLASAIQRIGFDGVKLHTLGLTIGRMYASPKLRKIWQHSVDAAQVARQLARQGGYSTEEAALVSLVHDIGSIVIFALGEAVESRFSDMQKAGETNVSIERHFCASSHADIGADLLHSWKFPEDLCEAVRFHHAPSQSKLPLASLLYLTESWLEENEDVYDPVEHSTALARLNLKRVSGAATNTVLDPDLQFLRSTA